MNPLNPTLYAALVRSFGHVRVTNSGQPANISRIPDWERNGQLKVEVRGGEEYVVNCPFCNDTRHRLSINHVWGTCDAKTGREILYPVICFNEDCVNNRNRQKDLRDQVLTHSWGIGRRQSPVIKSPTSKVAVRRGPIRLPGPLTPITSAKHAKYARQYLEQRGFDPDELGEKWNISYCHGSSDPSPGFHCRIVIPVYQPKSGHPDTADGGRVLAGWQARSVDTIEVQDPKYLMAAGMPKSKLLYGLPEALESEGPVVVAEGVTDVWRLGSNTVAMFGHKMSRFQRDLLLRCFEDRPIVMFLDRDASETSREAAKALRCARKDIGDKAKVVMAQLPDGRDDVGACSYEEAWESVATALGWSMERLMTKLSMHELA